MFTTKLGSDEEIFTTKIPKKGLHDGQKITTQVIVNEKPKKLIASTSPAVEPLHTPVPPQPTPPVQVESPKPELPPKMEHTKAQVVAQKRHSKSSPKEELDLSDISNRNSVLSMTEKETTSENSENDSEIEFINKKINGQAIDARKSEDTERKTLVFQTDSFDDELPYVPTTLPMERSVAMPIVPIKQRSTFEIKTRPIERPRSITPINPSCIDDYCGDSSKIGHRRTAVDKLKISLPKEDTIEKLQKLKSPRKGTNPKSWQEFAEKG